MRKVPKKWIRTPADELAIADGCWFDIKRANRVKEFFEQFLQHSQGEWAGDPFILLPWQWNDLIAPLFGWVRPNGTRRFRRAYIEIAKKNGKSTLCAGLSLYLLMADGEAGAEVYTAAADHKQASIVHNEAAKMVEASTELSEYLMVIDSTKTIGFPMKKSVLVALSAEVGTKEGLNIHGLIFDELHTQKTPALWNTLRHGGISRRQPLFIDITTAGVDQDSICREQHKYATGVLDGTIPDWSFFPYIRAADKEDDWTDPKVWKKANPSLGVTLKLEEFAEACREAQASPAKENTFKRYRLNSWTEQAVRWLRLTDWDKCNKSDGGIDENVLVGKKCYGGLDLSSSKDITAFSLLFPHEDGTYSCIQRYWLPGDAVHRRSHEDKVPYDLWAEQGLFRLTPGPVIDLEMVKTDVLKLCERFGVGEIAVDRWNATHMMQLLAAEGLEIVPFGQGYGSMSSPTKELEKLVLSAKLDHGGDSVLRWMASNVAVKIDDAENLKPSKEHSKERIDGIVALIMALGLSMVHEAETASCYEQHGIRTL